MHDNDYQTIQGFRLSPQQRRLWQLQQQSAAFVAQGVIEINGALCETTLRAALQQLVQRHDLLRAVFHELPGMKAPVMAIEETAELEWARGDAASAVTEDLASHLLRARQRPFALAEGPVLRAMLLSLAEHRSALILTLPALCADAASLSNLTAELSQLYTARQQGAGLPAPELSYVQYAEWQNQLAENAATGEGKAYWQSQQLAELPALCLPQTITTEPTTAFVPVAHEFFCDERLSARITETSQRLGTSASLFLQAVWQTLLARLSGQQEFVLGVIDQGREFEVLQTGVGLFARTLPVRSRWRFDQPFQQALAQLGEAVRSAVEWQDDFPWATEGEAGRQGGEFFPVRFEYVEASDEHRAGSVSFRLTEQYVCCERFHVKLVCMVAGEGLRLALQYDPHRLSGSAVARLAQQFLTALASACAQPEELVERLNILPTAERGQLLTFAQTTDQQIGASLFPQLFEAQVARVPERVAVVCEGQSLRYGELNRRANQLARFLRTLGVGPEVTVGLCAERSPELMVAMLGILKAGGAYAPLDPAQPKNRAAQMLEDLHARVLLTQQHLLDRLPTATERIVCLDRDWPLISAESDENLASAARPENLAYVLFTSGSTGRPKGVAVEHRQLLNYLQGIRTRLAEPDGESEQGLSYAAVSTFAADLGNTAIFPALASGGTLHIIVQERATDPEAFAAYFHEHAIDCLKIVPSHLAALLAAAQPTQVLPRRCLVLGGEATPPDLLEQVRRLRPECAILNHYGPTETTVGALTHAVGESLPKHARSLPLGRPLPNVQAYVLDACGQLTPLSVWGELYLGGAQVTRGYLYRPELTAEKFLPDPFGVAGGRLYRTGDRARVLPDGKIEFAGRLDTQIKFHGYRIELSEIRNALNLHPQVRDSVAVIAKDASGQDAIIAYYVARQELETAALRAFLSDHLLDAAIPNLFAHLKRLPLTLNGKLNYEALPTLAEIRESVAQQFVAPRTREEATTAEIWAGVLGLKRVSVEENFFELGGHSLLATQVISRMRAAFGVELQLRSLFETPTVAGLAATVAEKLAAAPFSFASTAPPARTEQGLEAQLAALEQMTEEEAQALLHASR